MPFVLATQKNWTKPFEFEILNDFKSLRDGVNQTGSVASCDAFMWEVFTTKKYYDNREIKQIGHIYTPWPSWIIATTTSVIGAKKEALASFLKSVNEGIVYFNQHNDEAVEHIAENLDYSAEDARAWLDTVKFVDDTTAVNPELIHKTLTILKAAKVLNDSADDKEYIVSVTK